MSNSIKISEGLKSIDRIKLLIEYNLSKTYSENLYILSEQKPDSMMPGQIERFGYTQGDPSTMHNALQKQQEYFKDLNEYRHEILQISAFGSLFIPVVGPFISLGLELADASLYYSEGDKYMAGFSLAFSLIPGAELAMKIPSIKKLTKESLVKIMRFFRYGKKSKVVLNETEKIAAEEIAKNSKWIKLTSLLNLVKLSLKTLIQKLSLRQFVKFILKWKKNNKIKFAILNMTIQIGGIMYTYDKLAEMLGISPSGEDVPPKVSLKKRQQLEKSFQTEKPKIEKQVIEIIDKTLTDEGSLMELQKLMNESLSQDTMSSS